MDKNISQVVKSLREKQREFQAKADKIEATIASIQEVFSEQLALPDLLPPVEASKPATNGPYSGMSIASASFEYLKNAGAPQKTRAIAEALQQAGIQSSDLYRAVYNALNRNDEVHIADSLWRLRQWTKG